MLLRIRWFINKNYLTLLSYLSNKCALSTYVISDHNSELDYTLGISLSRRLVTGYWLTRMYKLLRTKKKVS